MTSFFTISEFLNSKSSEKELLVAFDTSPKVEKPVFTISQSAYANLGEGILGSKTQRLKKQLESSIKFLGANTRPDYSNTLAFFSYKDKSLIFNEKQKYALSTISNEDFEEGAGFSFELKVDLPKVNFLISNSAGLSFKLSLMQEKDLKTAQIDQYKIDPYLLVRQKVSYVGPDLFLKNHGGKEFGFAEDSVRIDFMHAKIPYYHFVKKGDLLVWKNGQWEKADENSSLYSLMKIENVTDNQLDVSVFDVSGCKKVDMELKKAILTPIPKKLSSLKFIGAKSNKKWLFKSDKTRLSIEPGDWLVNLGHKWDKIGSIEAIDQYVNKLNMGELFIVNDLVDEAGKKVLKGDLYNLTRTNKIDYILDV